MITNSGAPVILSHNNSEVQKDYRQDSLQNKKRNYSKSRGHKYISRDPVLFSVQHDVKKDSKPRIDSDGFNVIE
jgi:hypothetical protein